MGVKGGDANLPSGKAIWAGAEALWLSPGLPLVVCACLDEPQWAAALALPPLAADLAEAAAYPADDRSQRFLQRRALLRSLVGRALGCAATQVAIAHDAQGAPQVESPAGFLQVSVAGRGPLAAFGLSQERIGVDLEPVGEAVKPAWNILHASERARLEGLAAGERHSAFLQIWTVKEAYMKMLGLGLRIEPAEVATTIGADDRANVRWSRTGGEWQAMQRAADVPEAPCIAEWRQRMLGGRLAHVAVAAQDSIALTG